MAGCMLYLAMILCMVNGRFEIALLIIIGAWGVWFGKDKK